MGQIYQYLCLVIFNNYGIFSFNCTFFILSLQVFVTFTEIAQIMS